MTDNATDRPLVTLAVFAYNQEQYIREAVEGAIAQTYEPLEIILSDDCSSDRTFEIMHEMAAAYEGAHNVYVRRNIFNLGTSQHVQLAFAESSGQLFVVAAGDDISTPDRVEVLVETWIAAECPEGVVHSGRERFRNGQAIEIAIGKGRQNSDRVLEGYARGYWLPAAAPTCAYTRGVFERFPPLFGGSIIEDAPLFLRAALLGRFIAVDKPLVRCRVHADNTGTGHHIDAPARWNRFIQSKVIAFRTMQRDLAEFDGPIDAKLRTRIESRILAVLGSASRLIILESRPLGALEKARLFIRLATSHAVAQTLPVRVNFALGFLGFTFQNGIKTLVCKFRSDQ